METSMERCRDIMLQCCSMPLFSCSYGVPFTASGNTKSSSASVFQFTYNMVRRLNRRTVLLDLHAAPASGGVRC